MSVLQDAPAPSWDLQSLINREHRGSRMSVGAADATTRARRDLPARRSSPRRDRRAARRPGGGRARGRRRASEAGDPARSEEHTSELQSLAYLVCRLLLEKKKKTKKQIRLTRTDCLL